MLHRQFDNLFQKKRKNFKSIKIQKILLKVPCVHFMSYQNGWPMTVKYFNFRLGITKDQNAIQASNYFQQFKVFICICRPEFALFFKDLIPNGAITLSHTSTSTLTSLINVAPTFINFYLFYTRLFSYQRGYVYSIFTNSQISRATFAKIQA